MTAHEYWNEEPMLINSYEEAFKQAEERKSREVEYSAWLNGYYFNRAYVSARTDKVKYPTNLVLYDERKRVEEESKLTEQQLIEREEQKVKDYINSYFGGKP